MGFKKTFDFATRINDRKFPLRVVRMTPQTVTDLHCHEFTELVIVYDGTGLHMAEGGPAQKLSCGNVFVVARGSYHQYLQDGLSLVNLIFDSDLLPLPLLDAYAIPYFKMILNGSPGSNIFMLTKNELAPILALVAALELELAGLQPGRRFMALSLFMQIIMQLSRGFGDTMEKSLLFEKNISRTIEQMHKHFTEQITISALAETANMSPRSLLRHFKRFNGVSPKEYLIGLRIDYASELLVTTRMHIDEIAFSAGFNDSNYFSREFNRVVGMTPSKYRISQQQHLSQV